MKLVCEEPFSKVVHAWLNSEWHKHHAPQYDAERHLIDAPDFNDKSQNARRLELLTRKRGNMLQQIPSDTQWFKAKYEAKDIPKTHVVPSADWLPISSNSYYLPTVLGNLETEYEHAAIIRKIYEAVPNAEIDPEIILVGSNVNSVFTIIDGNHRGVALIKHLQSDPKNPLITDIYIGLSPDMHKNIWHIESRVTEAPWQIAAK